MTAPEKRSVLNDSTLTVLKYVALILLPAAATLYIALASLWNFPNVEAVVGTITAIDTFLGVLLGLIKTGRPATYDGTIDVSSEGDKKIFTLNLHSDPQELDQKQEVLFKIESS